MSAEERERLLQELLEEAFGCHPDPEALRETVAAHPEGEALREEARALAEGLGEASREPAQTWSSPDEASRPGGAARSRTLMRLAAAVLFLVLPVWAAVDWFASRPVPDGPSPFTVEVHGYLDPTREESSLLAVATTDAEGEDVAAQLSWELVDADGVRREGQNSSTGLVELDLGQRPLGPASVMLCARVGELEQRVEWPLRAFHHEPLVHLRVDRPVVRPGESVHLRAVRLDPQSLEPQPFRTSFAVLDPLGNEVVDWSEVNAEDGVSARRWDLPSEAVGGEYRFVARSARTGTELASTSIRVRRIQPEMLRKQLRLDRESYGPGEAGEVELSVQTAEGEVAAGARVRFAIRVDGQPVWRQRTQLDEAGRAKVAFALPSPVAPGEANLVAEVRFGGVVETVLEPFLVPGAALDVRLHPEGGQLAAGVENRVYFEVLDPRGRPVSARGRLVDAQGEVQASFRTEHQGRGSFECTPRVDQSLWFEVEQPEPLRVAVPAASVEAVSLRVEAPLAGEPLRLRLASARDEVHRLSVYRRGLRVAEATLRPRDGEVQVPLAASLGGVLRVTVFDASGAPVAERRVCRPSSQELHVAVERSEVAAALPGSTQELFFRTTDERGQPVSAVLGVSVTDRANREGAAEPRVGLADGVRLFADVEDLEDVDTFFAAHPDAIRHADLLLGTQGWSRFVWKDPRRVGDDPRVERLLLLAELIDPSRWGPEEFTLRRSNAAELQTREAERAERRASREARASWLVLGLGVAALLGLGLWMLRTTRRGALPISMAAAGAVGFLAATGTWPAGLDSRRELVMETPQVARAEPGSDALWSDEQGLRTTWWAHDFLVRRDEQSRQRSEVDWLHALGYPGEGESGEAGLAGSGIHVAAHFASARHGRWRFFEPPPPLDEARDLLRHRSFQPVEREGLVLVREYAHRHAEPVDGVRDDFAETAYWNAALTTDEEGRARCRFDLSDRSTAWSIEVDAHGEGRVGQAEAEFASVPPLNLVARIPAELSQGDRLALPVAVSCLDESVETATVEWNVDGPLRLEGPAQAEVPLEEGRGRALIRLEVLGAAASGEEVREGGARGEGPPGEVAPGDAPRSLDTAAVLHLSGEAGDHADARRQELRVVPRGYPVRRSRSGALEGTASFEITVPRDMVPGTLRTELLLYPSPLDDLLEGIDALVRQPGGCFEQASARHYPNVLALNLMRSAGQVPRPLEQRTLGLIADGMARLGSYECPSGGFDWWGEDPAHATLTGYGLLEFVDTREVWPGVDAGMIARTREWIRSRRDGEGGFLRDATKRHAFGGAPAELTDSYLAYALAGSGDDGVDWEPELARLLRRAEEIDDAYELGLIAGALHAWDRDDVAELVRRRLQGMQEEDGSLCGATTITASGGEDRRVETTAFAILAWLDGGDEYEAAVRRATVALLERRRGRGFGSTQATVMALKALSAHAQAARRMEVGGTVRLVVDGQPVARRSFEAGHQGALRFRDFADRLPPGRRRIELHLDAEGTLPWSFDLHHHAERPDDHPDAVLVLRSSLDETALREGETTSLALRLVNLSGDDQPMAIAGIGLPAGLELSDDVLEAARDGGHFAAWERRGREIFLYWRGLPAGAERDLRLDVHARVPGITRGPASRVWLYYTPERVRWAPPLEVTVVPR